MKSRPYLCYLLLCSCSIGLPLLLAAPPPASTSNSHRSFNSYSESNFNEKKQNRKSYKLQKALEALRQAKLKRARLFVILAQKKDSQKDSQRDSRNGLWDEPENKPQSTEDSTLLSLEALLSFFLEGPIQAKPKLLNAFQRQEKPLAGFAYFLGNYFLRQAYFSEAADYFERAVKLSKGEQKKNKEAKSLSPLIEKNKTSDMTYALAPSLCIQTMKELEKYEKKSWRRLQRQKAALWLWELISRPLSSEQAALALHQAYVFAPQRRKELALLLPKSSYSNLSKDLSALLLNPGSEAKHAKCILNLKKVYTQLVNKAKRGANFQTRIQKKFIGEHLLASYHRKFLLLNNAKAAYDYGIYLLEKRKSLAALHALRRALELLGTNLHVFKNDKNKLLELQNILHALHSVYEEYLKRQQDAQALSTILSIISEYSPLALSSSRKTVPRPSEWIQHIHRACRSNLHNREALVFLYSHAKYKASSKRSFYQRKLLQRDEAFAEQELSLGFRHLGLGVQKQD